MGMIILILAMLVVTLIPIEKCVFLVQLAVFLVKIVILVGSAVLASLTVMRGKAVLNIVVMERDLQSNVMMGTIRTMMAVLKTVELNLGMYAEEALQIQKIYAHTTNQK